MMYDILRDKLGLKNDLPNLIVERVSFHFAAQIGTGLSAPCTRLDIRRSSFFLSGFCGNLHVHGDEERCQADADAEPAACVRGEADGRAQEAVRGGGEGGVQALQDGEAAHHFELHSVVERATAHRYAHPDAGKPAAREQCRWNVATGGSGAAIQAVEVQCR